jgi:hypothetical protein
MRSYLAGFAWIARNWALKIILVVTAAIVAVCASPMPAAADSPPPVPVKLSVAADTARPGSLVLTVQVPPTSVSAGATVAFFVVTKEFGSDTEVPIETADLSKSGVVGIGYKPTWNGQQTFTVHVLSAAGATSGSARAGFDVSDGSPGPLNSVANHPRPFSTEGAVFLAGLLSAVALVWLALIATLVRVVIRLPKLG